MIKQPITQVQVRYEALLECGHRVAMTKSQYERHAKRPARPMGCYKCTENGTQTGRNKDGSVENG